MKSDVAVVKCDSYVQDEVDAAVNEAVALLGGIRSFVKPGDKVLLKPNFLRSGSADKAITTHPAVVSAVIRLVQSAGGVVFVGDSPAVGSGMKVAESSGVLGVCKEAGVQLVDFYDAVDVSVMDGKRVKKFRIAKAVMDADVVINVPKNKTHSFALYTGAVKNLFGCIPGLDKGEFHLKFPDAADFSDMLLDLYLAVRPALSIMDAVVSMEGPGPSAGTVRKTGLVAASADAVALDAVMCSVSGLPVADVPVLVRARARGIGEADLARIAVLGISVDGLNFKFKYERSGLLANLPGLGAVFKGVVLPRPRVMPGCIGCGVCADGCPAEAITVTDKKAVISYKDCIRCFCCHEVCPQKAVAVHYPLSAKVFLKLKSFAEKRLFR